jgi:hypothetical protein
VLARRLQLGDPGGHLREALAHFPAPATAERSRNLTRPCPKDPWTRPAQGPRDPSRPKDPGRN